MARLKFESYPGVVGRASTNNLTLLLDGPASSLKKIKAFLTMRSKSAKWKVARATKNLEFWKSKPLEVMDERMRLKVEVKIAAAQADLTEYGPLVVQTMYEDLGGRLEVPAGFWWLAESIEGDVHKNREIKFFAPDWLRDYQVAGLGELLKYKRATLCLATGLGKTAVILGLCTSAVKANKRVCVVVPTEELVEQVLETLSKYIKNITAVGGKRKHPKLGADVMVITAASAQKYIDGYHAVIIDESHHSSASTWVNLLTNAEKCTHVYNLTATAFRSDGLDLAIHAFGGPVVYERDARWGITNGWLKPLKAYMSTVESKRPDGSVVSLPDSIPATKAYTILVQSQSVLQHLKRVLLRALNGGNRRCMVLFRTVAAGEAFVQVCRPELDLGVASSKFRKPLADFRSGTSQVLISNDKLVSEGIDVPNANLLIQVIQNSSDIITSQALGRVLRKSEGDAIVIDVTVSGYAQFDRAQNARASVYASITDDVSLMGTK